MNNFISFSEFQKSTSKNNQTIEARPKEQKVVLTSPNDSIELKNKLEKAKKKNGIIEKISDKIKNLTNIGIGSKKVEQAISDGKSNEECEKLIKNYSLSQENTSQAVGDIASCGASLGAFFGLKQFIEKTVAKYVTINNSKEEVVNFIKKANESIEKDGFLKKITKFGAEFADKNLDKRSTAIIAATIGAIAVGGYVKSTLLNINNIGSKKYKPEITDDMSKKDKKLAKKQARKEKLKDNSRNTISGMLNGLCTPLVSVLGVVGAPLYVLANSLSRYFIGTKADKGEKSLNGYIENLKASPIVHGASAVAIAIPAIKKGSFNKVFEKNFDKTVEKLKNAQLTKTVSQGKTSYMQLEEVLFGNEKIKNLMDSDISIDSKIQQLSDENIFALKFKQINSNSDELARALKTDCPPTRTIDEAQDIISKTFGDKYKAKKCVGVGTVAETYLVETKDGKEACIKMLKNGITAEKIETDKQKFIEIINGLENKTPEEKEFLIKNIENIAQGVVAEVDLKNEMKAAQELAKVTKKAQVVKPIEVQDNIYVMEKADGVSLSDFGFYNKSKWRFEDSEGKIKDRKYFADIVEDCKKKCNSYLEELQEAKEQLGTPEAEHYSNFVFIGNEPRIFRNEEGLKEYIEYLEKNMDSLTKDAQENYKEALACLKDYDKFVELRKLNIDDISEKDAQRMLESYQDILIEQFSEVNKTGKIIHGDIHPGNIFIDVAGLKSGKKDFFTLIDTGNTIQQNQEMAMRFLNLTSYIKNADYENITDFVLEGAKLPEGLSKEVAREKIANELKTAFFDKETNIGHITNDNILAITDGIMQKLNIIPADTQGNLMKSKTSATQSMQEFQSAFLEAIFKKFSKYDDITKENIASATVDVLKASGKMEKTTLRQPIKQKLQENANLAQLSAADRVKLKQSKTTPKKNSEDFLTFELKQNKKSKQGTDILDNII